MWERRREHGIGAAGEKYCPVAKSEAREGGRRTLKLSDAVQSTLHCSGGAERVRAERERERLYYPSSHLAPNDRQTDRTPSTAGGRTGNADNSAAKVPFVRRARSIISIKVLRM